jgi:pyrroline-5-carboxylate reductase
LTRSAKSTGTTLFIGGGSIGAAMISGLRLAKYAPPIAVHDRSAERMRLIQRKYRTSVESDLAEALRHARLIVLAVRPDAAADLLEDLNRALRLSAERKKKIVVSVIAGLPLVWLRSRITTGVDWVRAMPSPMCESGNGIAALTFGSGCSKVARNTVKQLFRSFGEVLELSESQFNAFTVVYSPSHGVHALSALSEAGVRAGLRKKTALIAAAHALSAAGLALKQGGDLNKMVKQAATPGGTAEATMAGMDAAGYRAAVTKGVQAGVARARYMAQSRD